MGYCMDLFNVWITSAYKLCGWRVGEGRMKFELNSLWKTRDGRKARIICNDRNSLYSIVALVGYSHEVCLYKENGFFMNASTLDALDLIEPWHEPNPKVRMWLWEYRSTDPPCWKPSHWVKEPSTKERDEFWKEFCKGWPNEAQYHLSDLKCFFEAGVEWVMKRMSEK